MCEHGDVCGCGHEHVGHVHNPNPWFPYGFSFPHRMNEFHGYRLPLTKEEELKLLEQWKTKMEKSKTKIDNKLVRIEQRIKKLKESGER